MGRRQRKKDETRRAIAESAMRLFLENGYEKVTIAQIAEVADVSVNTVFNYFPTKEDLFFGAGANGGSEFALMRMVREPHESVIAFLRRFLDTWIEHYPATPVTCWPRSDTWRRCATLLSGKARALQVHASQASRSGTQDREESFALALAKDMKAEADDLTPRLIAAQVTAISSSLFFEAERRRRVGERPEKIQAMLRASARIALNLLEEGIRDYGRKRQAKA